jgi:hypothetical protein
MENRSLGRGRPAEVSCHVLPSKYMHMHTASARSVGGFRVYDEDILKKLVYMHASYRLVACILTYLYT